jgi:DNA-directed RNA polymerase
MDRCFLVLKLIWIGINNMKASNQIELEKQNLDIVIQRTLAEINKASQSKTVAELKQSNNIIPYYVAELETKINVYLQEALLGMAKIKPVPAKALTLVSPLIVSHYTVKVIMNNIGGKLGTGHTLYQTIAKHLEIEYNLNTLKQTNADKYGSFVNYIKGRGYSGARLSKITLDLMTKYHADIMGKNLTSVFMQVAQLAVNLLAECRPIIGGEIAPHLLHMATIKEEANKSKTMLIPADWILEWMKTQTMEGNMIPNYHTALIEPPKDWVELRGGGFHTDRFQNNFIRTKVDPAKFKANKMKRTMDAVNAIQKTEWEINTDVLNVMLYAFNNKLNWGELPAPTEILATPYPFPELTRDQMNEQQLAQVKEWAQHKAHQHDEQHAEISRYLALNRVLNEAKRFTCYDRLYFAYQVDFRGRIYPIAANLNPQGAGFVKPLLRFHTGKPITNKFAEMYLALQGANTYGQDKIRLEDKHQWVLDNEESIADAASDPISNDFWKSADEPWSFLAFCFEWSAYRANPKTFLSKLPVALDGSCNGLQHLSAMLRDEVGGREVNLTANYNKLDIYSAVKEIAVGRIKELNTDLGNKVLQFGIERSTCKRPVMIMPYAGTQSSCREYVQQDFIDRGGKGFFGTDFKEAVTLTSNTIWSSIGSVVIKGREIMSWFKKAARKSAKLSDDCEIEWTTPNGFLVIQRRTKTKEVLYQTGMGDKINVRLSLRMHEDTDEIDLHGHASAVSPNFIHSLDACALQETVLLANENGIQSFAMIHDSYGTHAADTYMLAHYLRRTFVNMYTHNDVLGAWINSQPLAAQAEFEPLPESGNLDLEEIMNSEHFFA